MTAPDPQPTLAAFLLARVAEDEEAAHATRGVGLVPDFPDGCWTERRVLAECEAKRRIVAEHAVEVERVSMSPFDPTTGEKRPAEWDVTCRVCGWADYDPSGGCATLKLLALPYAGHSDYQEAWRV